MTELEKVIKSFAEQIASGYTCEDKKSKYAKDIDDNYPDWYNGKKYGHDYCTVFYDWNFIHAMGEDRARTVLNRPKKSCGAGVRWSRQYLLDIGRVGTTPKVGCAVYFGKLPYPRHIGFVYKVTESMIYTYEGNCYVSQNVSGVKARSYKRTDPDILDYGYPVYKDGPAPEPDPKEMDGYKVGSVYEVICNDPLNIRKGPGTAYEKTGSLKKGDLIECKALRHDGSGNTWLEFSAGWACGIYQGEKYIAEPKKQRGWVKDGGKWYFYNDNGQMVKNGWVTYKGDKYRMGPDGSMLTGWQTIDKMDYYFHASGAMACGEWRDGWFLDMDGRKTGDKGAWKKDDKGRWFQAGTWYPKNRWIRIDGRDYEFDGAGYVKE